MKRVLILGSGMVAGPIIKYLLSNNFFVTVAGFDIDRAYELTGKHQNSDVVKWDAYDLEGLEKLVANHDLAVSLLPYKFHVDVAKVCLNQKKHMVTTSYVKPEMGALDAKAKEAGVIILNELGVDPGIDHMSAMRIINHVHNKGGKIEEFYSITGALPAPELIDNPLGYKFSWSPKGVILASQNDATYLLKGEEIYIEPKRLFQDRFTYDFPEVGTLDVYPNRNSKEYTDIYGIPEAKTMFRGTFRYTGWCATLDAFKQLNLISTDTADYTDMTYAQFVAKTANLPGNDVEKEVAESLGIEVDSDVMESFRYLGLLENTPMNRKEDSPFEITSDIMIEKMLLNPGERDMVAMQHVFLATYDDGSKEVIKSRLLDFGQPGGETSIARTVALPAAVGVKKILEGDIKLTGVYRPVVEEIYEPVMNELEEMGIKMIEEYGLPESENIQK